MNSPCCTLAFDKCYLDFILLEWIKTFWDNISQNFLKALTCRASIRVQNLIFFKQVLVARKREATLNMFLLLTTCYKILLLMLNVSKFSWRLRKFNQCHSIITKWAKGYGQKLCTNDKNVHKERETHHFIAVATSIT